MVGTPHNTRASVSTPATWNKGNEITNQTTLPSAEPVSATKEIVLITNRKVTDHTDSINVPTTTSTSLVTRSVTETGTEDDGYSANVPLEATNTKMTKSEHSAVHKVPSECYQDAHIEVHFGPVWRKMHVRLDPESLTCSRTSLFRRKPKTICIVADDIIGGAIVKGSHELTVHYMKAGRGNDEEKLKRRYRTLRLRLNTDNDATKWVHALQLLVKWHARVPPESVRRIKVVVNPYSGKKRGLQIWEHWKPLFELAGIECDLEVTKHSGHARDIGKDLDLSIKYESIVFVGGDGTVNEFTNGVFSRDESEWRYLVATTPVSLLCAGTDNAFGIGVGIPTHEAAVFCAIKRKIRPLDVLVCETESSDGTIRREFACCGVSYGIGADIAMESENTRWLGVHRYKWLKIKRGVLAPRPHNCTIKYVLSDSVNVDSTSGNQLLCTYYEKEKDHHRTEMCTVYDNDEMHPKRWDGDAACIFNPASEGRYAGQWQEEADGNYATVGASNVYFETEFYHPSDGNMDLIIARRGPVTKTIDVGLKYIGGNYLESSLIDYYKVKALVIEQNVDDPLNVDGELFPGPGPFRIEVVPHLLNVLSEK